MSKRLKVIDGWLNIEASTFFNLKEDFGVIGHQLYLLRHEGGQEVVPRLILL